MVSETKRKGLSFFFFVHIKNTIKSPLGAKESKMYEYNDLTPRCYLKWDLDMGKSRADMRDADFENRRYHRESNPLNLATAQFEGGTVFMLTDDHGDYCVKGYVKDGWRLPVPDNVFGVIWLHRRVHDNSAVVCNLLSAKERAMTAFQ